MREVWERIQALIYYFFKEVRSSLSKNIGMAMVTVITIAMAMLMFEMSILAFLNFRYIEHKVFSYLKIHAYLSDKLSSKDIKKVIDEVSAIDGVVDVTFVPKDKVFKRAIAGLELNVEKKVAYNPMPNLLEVSVESPDMIDGVASKLLSIKGIQDVEYWQRYLRRFRELRDGFEKVTTLVVLILIVASLFIIGNTIRLTILAREKEITIMYLVGAPLWYIKTPLIVEGILYSLLGALVSIFTVHLLYLRLYEWIRGKVVLLSLLPPSYISKVDVFIVISAMLIGLIGSYLSIRLHLEKIASLSEG